jgi:imidazole glycerol-phosphate synthase subunit HisH
MIAIIDYDMGNTSSVRNACELFHSDVQLTSDPAVIAMAEKIILPGVGAFGDGMKHLRDRGLVAVLEERVLVKKIPFLGICIGMQLLAKTGTEHGHHDGLGWISAEVVKIVGDDDLRIPHVGWDDVVLAGESAIFSGLEKPCFYFVHSYVVRPDDESIVTSWCDYGDRFPASIEQDNIYATQFHPEKSQKDGLQVLKNFICL